MNRDHSVVFEVASRYCISDSFVDYDGYSISSKGFLPTVVGSYKKQESSRKIYFCFIDYAKAFDCVDHSKLWIILQPMGIPGHLTCLLRNLYSGQEATVRIGHGTMDWFQIRKGVRQGCIFSPCLFSYMQSTSCKMPCWMKHKLE